MLLVSKAWSNYVLNFVDLTVVNSALRSGSVFVWTIRTKLVKSLFEVFLKRYLIALILGIYFDGW